jgi:hypothetical protein
LSHGEQLGVKHAKPSLNYPPQLELTLDHDLGEIFSGFPMFLTFLTRRLKIVTFLLFQGLLAPPWAITDNLVGDCFDMEIFHSCWDIPLSQVYTGIKLKN